MRIKNALRWMAVLPAGILAFFVIGFPLHYILYSLLPEVGGKYPEAPERFLQPILGAFAFVWVGSRVAPTKHFWTAVVLGSAYVVVVCFTIWFVGRGVTVGRVQFEPALFRQICCIAAAVAAVFTVALQSPGWDEKILNQFHSEDEGQGAE